MSVELEEITVEAGEHVVQFYEDDSQLAQTVGGYLIRALEDGAVAIVIATEAHRRLFSSELEAAGLDPVEALRDGTLVLLDAAETLTRFTHAGEVDRAGFRRIVGSVVSRAGEAGRPIRAYGEMVALLWEDGDVLAAIELEKAWNDLACELPFALVCAYPSEAVQGQEHADALHEVCHLHTAVVDSEPHVPSPKLCAHYAPEREAPAAARHFVAEVLERWGHSRALLEDAKLVVSELASNAVVHARSPFSVEIRPHGAAVRVAVLDASRERPTVRDNDMAASGRGMRLVDMIAAKWGVELAGEGKTVWAELQP
jgi:anti-sigma regulatory factor (Ser/Thr protein kinase)